MPVIINNECTDGVVRKFRQEINSTEEGLLSITYTCTHCEEVLREGDLTFKHVCKIKDWVKMEKDIILTFNTYLLSVGRIMNSDQNEIYKKWGGGW